jgi:hypothetical protein
MGVTYVPVVRVSGTGFTLNLFGKDAILNFDGGTYQFQGFAGCPFGTLSGVRRS